MLKLILYESYFIITFAVLFISLISGLGYHYDKKHSFRLSGIHAAILFLIVTLWPYALVGFLLFSTFEKIQKKLNIHQTYY